MKKKYNAEDLTYEQLVAHGGEEVSVSAYGITGKARITVDEDGDVHFKTHGSKLWICYSHSAPEYDVVEWIEFDEKFELDWNEVIEHPVIVPGPEFHAGEYSYWREMQELNELMQEDGGSMGFDYEAIPSTDRPEDSRYVLYYTDHSVN